MIYKYIISRKLKSYLQSILPYSSDVLRMRRAILYFSHTFSIYIFEACQKHSAPLLLHLPPPPNDLQVFFSQLCWILISGSFHKLHFKVVPSMQWLHLRTAKINSSSNFIAFNVSLDIFQIFLHFLWTWLTRVSCILGICCCFIQQHSWYDFQFKIFQFLLKLQCLCNAYTGLHTLLNLLNIRCTPTLS